MRLTVKPRGFLALALVVFLALLTVKLAPPARAQTTAATIQGFAFHPASLTVTVGTTVTWTNQDTATHTVTSDTGAFDSGNLATGATFSFTFNQAGTFAYHCNIHPNMHGTVVVQQAAPATNTPAPTATVGGTAPTPTATAGSAAPTATSAAAAPTATATPRVPLRAVPAPSQQLVMGPPLNRQQMAWQGYYDAHKDTYLSTDVSLKSQATAMHITFAPGLQKISAANLPLIYLVQGRSAAAQLAVFGSEPGSADYSPLWREAIVQWKPSSKAALLTSDNQILDLSKKGRLTVRMTNVVLNCPIIKVGK